jgi:predicted lipoprotein with Yx(FWY)xxD motif
MRDIKRRNAVIVLLAALAVTAVFVGTVKFSSNPHVKKAQDVVKVHATAQYGKILVTRGGFTLYTYQLDTKNHSNCYAFCLQMWPPLVVPTGDVPTGDDVTGLGTITRSNGERQVTYEGMPLYGYVLDHVPGRTAGEGDGWSVVRLPGSQGTATKSTTDNTS